MTTDKQLNSGSSLSSRVSHDFAASVLGKQQKTKQKGFNH